MKSDTKNDFCEVVDLAKYRAKKEKEEIDAIYEEVHQLKQEILCMLDEMETPIGPLLWHQEFIDAAPHLRKLIELLEECEKNMI